MHAMDFRETFRELWIGCIYLWEKMKGREPMVDKEVRRLAHYETAFEKPRASVLPGSDTIYQDKSKDRKDYGKDWDHERTGMLPNVEVEREEYVDIGGTRQWLGYGKNYGYGIHRDPSEGLEYQIERELERRGYGNGTLMY
jgi:hypothetical protein